jgi:hypothetical protein
MSAVKREFFELTHTSIGPLAPAPTASPTPALTHIHLLTYFGEPIGAYADNESAMADLAVMRHGAWLNSRDDQEIDAYAVKTLPITKL